MLETAHNRYANVASIKQTLVHVLREKAMPVLTKQRESVLVVMPGVKHTRLISVDLNSKFLTITFF